MMAILQCVICAPKLLHLENLFVSGYTISSQWPSNRAHDCFASSCKLHICEVHARVVFHYSPPNYTGSYQVNQSFKFLGTFLILGGRMGIILPPIVTRYDR